MDLENLNRLRQEFPEMANRTTLLGLFGTPDRLAIADPYLADEAATNRICEQVREGVEGLAPGWQKESVLPLPLPFPLQRLVVTRAPLTTWKEILLQNVQSLAQRVKSAR